MKWSKENIYFLSLTVFYVIDLILLIVSQTIDEWFHYTKVDGCEWKGSHSKIYSSACYTHKTYADSDCKYECICCHESGLASLKDLEGVSLCIIINFSLMIIWIIFCIMLNTIKILRKFTLYWKIYSISYIFIGIISCFFTGSSHPGKVDLKSGYVLRLASILLFYLFGILHLFYCCRFILKNQEEDKNKQSMANELIESDRIGKMNEQAKNDRLVNIQ